MANLQFAIPSYKRAKKVQAETLQTLTDLSVPGEIITVFVADKEEEKEYRDCLGKSVNIVVGFLGIGNQRKFINEYYKKGTRIVCLDDDVRIIRKNANKVVPLTEPLVGLVTRAFDLCDDLGLKFWGVPNTNNGLFMKHQCVSGIRAICGVMYGEYAQIAETQSTLPHSEDLEKALLHYVHFGGILRLDDVSVKQKKLAEGGVNAYSGGKENRFKIYRETVDVLLDRYPDLVRLVNEDDPGKGLTKIRNKTTGRYASLLSL
jgi:hypothetical protein